MSYRIKILILLLSFAGIMACSQKTKEQAPYDLTLSEGFSNPIGFYNDQPTFSWKLPTGVQAQSAYEIVTATSPELLPDSPDLWKSGKVKSEQSLYVKYEGVKLLSRQKVYWQVRYFNQDGKESNWSEKAFFELGLLNNKDWNAKWISLPDQKAVQIPEIKRKVHRVQYLRKNINLSSDVEKARLYITVKGLFKAHINGKTIGNDALTPGWTSYENRIETLSYDVSEELNSGNNTLAIELAEGWHSGRLIFRKKPQDAPQILAQLEVVHANGEREVFVTDNSWKGTNNGPIKYAGLYDGESYDANFELPAWTTPDYDDAEWLKVVDQPVSKDVKLVPKRHQTIKTKVLLPTQSITEPTKGAVVFDLGQNMAGIKPLVAGYKEFQIAPVLGGPLTSAKATYNSPFGAISSAWKIENGVFELQTTIPPNTKAKIVLPAKNKTKLLLGGQPFSKNANVKLLKEGDFGFELEALPGSYVFKTEYK